MSGDICCLGGCYYLKDVPVSWNRFMVLLRDAGRVRVVFMFAWREASFIDGIASDALLNAYLPSGD